MKTDVRNEGTELWALEPDEQQIATIELHEAGEGELATRRWVVKSVDGNFIRERPLREAAINAFIEDGYVVPALVEQRRHALSVLRTRAYYTEARLAEIKDMISAMWVSKPADARELEADLRRLDRLNASFSAHVASPDANLGEIS